MLNFCDFIQIYIFRATNHHLKANDRQLFFFFFKLILVHSECDLKGNNYKLL